MQTPTLSDTAAAPRPASAALRERLLRLMARYDGLAPLLLRLVFGYFWLETGWAKLHNLDGFAARFANWGIPLPELSAAVSAGTEFAGGLLIMLGLATRLTMLPMIFNMLVALAVVVLPGISTLDEFVELDEVLYVLVFFWLLMAGPGRVSVDAWLASRPRPAR